MPSAYQNCTSSGYTTVVAAPSAGFIRVHSYLITAFTEVDRVKLCSASTDKLGLASTVVQGGGASMPYCADGYFDCAPLEALRANLSDAGDVDVNVTYSIQGA